MNGPRASRPMSTPALAAYYGTAVLAGVIVAMNALPFPFDVVVLLGLGILATWIRYQAAGRDSFSSSISWAALFVVVWLPLAFVLHRWPFS